MRLIDFHTHIYPDAIADKATQSIRAFYEMDKGGLHGTAEVLIERGKIAGINEFVVHPVALKPTLVHKINQSIIDAVSKHSEFYGFGTVHADMDNMEQELEFIERSGLLGIKIHPDTQLFNIDDPRLYKLYDYISGKMPIMFHAGDPRYDYSHPRRIKKIMNEFPSLQVIAAHFGGWGVQDEAYSLLGEENCFVDISSSIMFINDDLLYKYINGYGADRILFGSDFPLWDPKEEVDVFMKLKLSDSDREKIAYKNALRILEKKY